MRIILHAASRLLCGARVNCCVLCVRLRGRGDINVIARERDNLPLPWGDEKFYSCRGELLMGMIFPFEL